MSSPATDAWSAGPGGEKLRGKQQFGFAEHGALDSLADLGGIGGVGAGQRDRGLERTLQAVVAHVADEQRPAGGQQIHGVVDDLGQISRVGEVLDDRVENDGVEVAPRQRSVTWAGWVSSSTRSRHGICNCSSERARLSMATAEKSVATY